MIGAKQLILLLENNGQGTLKEFPSVFPLPDHTTISTKDDPITYHKTNRVRQTNGQDAVIYTRQNCRLNLDDYATGYTDEAPGIQAVPESPQTPHVNQAQISPKQQSRNNSEVSPLNITVYYNPETEQYESHMGVGSSFNKRMFDELGEEVLTDLLNSVMDELRLKAKKKSRGYIEDTTELE